MADGLAYLKFFVENRKILLSLLFLLFPSLGASLWGNYRQSVTIDRKQEQIQGQQKQIVGIAEQIQPYIVKHEKTTIIQPDYSKVQQMIDKSIQDHVRKFH